MMNSRRAVRRRVVKDIEKEIPTKKIKKTNIDSKDLLPTGSALFNLALSDNTQGGFQKGKMANIIGDSSSGKTFLCLSCFAEANQREEFDEYRFIFDDTEEASEFNLAKLFGKGTTKRIEPPRTDDGLPVHSNTIQDLWDNLAELLEQDTPFIYVCDSFDGLDEVSEQEKVIANRKRRRAGQEETGSYGMKKAKIASDMFKDIIPKLKKSGSILLIISQTRDNINPTSFAKKTRSGGNALKFYATHEVWLANAGQIKKKDQIIGYYAKGKVSKNKLTGKHRIIQFPIFYDYGIDSIRSAIEFCVETGYWSKKKQTIIADDLGAEYTILKLIEVIEENDREGDLYEALQIAWDNREEDLKPKRKSKYS